MRRKVLLCIAVLQICLFSLIAYGYPRAEARYLGNAKHKDPYLAFIDLQTMFINGGFRVTPPRYGMSLSDITRVWSALKEYDLKNNEIYSVRVPESDTSGLFFVVVIENNGKSYQRYVFHYDRY
ncbi:MAG: hypothetical protein J1E59_02560 [Treponema sp.]|nr:hypothetical protein [Treponema sp.]